VKTVLTHAHLAGELEALGRQARDLAGDLHNAGDLPARQLAGAVVEVVKLSDRLAKLHKQLHAPNGKKK
jgi:hypothetical protein